MASTLMNLDEKLSILITMLSISLVFGSNYLLMGEFIGFIIVSLVTSLAVIVHELSHKYTAISLGCYSKYVLHPTGLVLTLVSAIPFMPIKIIMPGVTLVFPYTYDPYSLRRVNGITSLAGPLSNILLAIFSAIAINVAYSQMPLILKLALAVSLSVNSWIALFNLIPVPPLDGSKVISWNILVWLLLFALSLLLYLLSRL